MKKGTITINLGYYDEDIVEYIESLKSKGRKVSTEIKSIIKKNIKEEKRSSNGQQKTLGDIGNSVDCISVEIFNLSEKVDRILRNQSSTDGYRTVVVKGGC